MDWLKKAAANVESKLAQSGLADKLKPVTVAAGQAAGETTSLFKSIGSSIESSFNEASKGEHSMLSCLSPHCAVFAVPQRLFPLPFHQKYHPGKPYIFSMTAALDEWFQKKLKKRLERKFLWTKWDLPGSLLT
jgi:hypothetical protein